MVIILIKNEIQNNDSYIKKLKKPTLIIIKIFFNNLL